MLNPTSKNIAAILTEMQKRHILVLGDVMLDRFVDGNVTRISPEAPVPVLSQTKVQQMPGGAANVACNLAQLGVNVTLVGVLGEDENGKALINEIARYPAINFIPIKTSDRPTNVKTRFRAASQQILRVDEEVVTQVNTDVQEKFFTSSLAFMETADLFIFSDYAKGALTPELVRKLIMIAKKKEKIVVVDPKAKQFSCYSGADILTPNLEELNEVAGQQIYKISEISNFALSLSKKNNIGGILTTLSSRGMLLSQVGGENFHLNANTREVFDVSGAGDTVVASVGGALSTGARIEDSVFLANYAAGVVVGKSGTATAVAGEILASMDPVVPSMDWDTCIKLCNKWRGSGQKIAFTNGCFDLLHPGHLHLLQIASRHADKLIVGLNDDSSVKQLKGESRPKQPVRIRGAVLGCLDFVHGIALFPQETPIELVKLLKPDIIVKGGDYESQRIVGSDVVEAYGGKTVIVPTLPGYSTTSLTK